MPASTTLLPVLHEADWSGAQFAAAKPLVEADAEFVPIVTLAHDSASQRRYVSHTELLEDGFDPELQLVRARSALARRAIALRSRDDGTHVAIDEYASSLLACPDELERIRRELDVPALLLAAPTRGCLVVVPTRHVAATNLHAFARTAFAEAFDTRLSPLVFRWERGALAIETEPGTRAATLNEVAYDSDDERLVFAVTGELDPSTTRALVAMLDRGEASGGRPLAELVLRLEAGRTLPAALRRDDVVVSVESP